MSTKNRRRDWVSFCGMFFCLLAVSTASIASVGGDFALRDPSGRLVRLSQFHGKVVVLAFGFTHCPDICPTELLQFKQLLSDLGTDARRLQPIFISVDPARDTPQVLSEYVEHFSDKILPLTGTQEELTRVARQYGTYFRHVPQTGGLSYTIDHSGNTYVIDTQGALSAIHPYGTPLEHIIRSVRLLLPGLKSEKSPAEAEISIN